MLSVPFIQRMRERIETLRAKDWPPVFAFVYDEFWHVARAPFLAHVLSQALGPGHLQLPNLWAHYVYPNNAGWSPHVDGRYGADKVSLWIPLSDATVSNGCMDMSFPKVRSQIG